MMDSPAQRVRRSGSVSHQISVEYDCWRKDLEDLRIAFNSKGEESTIINILCRKSNAQRLEINTAYTNKYGKDLSQDISATFSSKCLRVMLALLEYPNEFLARELEKALSGLRTDDEVISEILCTRTNHEIADISSTFQRLFGRTLQNAINADHNLSSSYKELITMVLSGSRHEGSQPSEEKVRKRTVSIHNAVEEGWSTATKIFMRLLTHESFAQLCLIFDDYRLISGLAMQEAVKTTFSGDVGYAALTIVKAAINKSQFYAECLEVAVKKLRRDDGTLIRIFVSSPKWELDAIKAEYLKIHHKTLYNAIRTETKGDYREAMLALLGTP